MSTDLQARRPRYRSAAASSRTNGPLAFHRKSLPVASGAAQAPRPGFDHDRLLRLMRDAISACELDLTGRTVMTEAASGAYVVTPAMAAMAGAEVIAVTRTTRYGSAQDIERNTLALAELAGVRERIAIVLEKSPALISRADIVTNSGHLRPIDAATAGAMKKGAVVPLMFESWELQAGRIDVDLDALRDAGIAFAGTNERHPNVDVFSYLGLMAIKLLLDAGVAAYRARIAVLCDNPFSEFIQRSLVAAGATVSVSSSLDALLTETPPDALIVAQRPTGGAVISSHETSRIAARWPGTLVAQFWGDIDREDLATAGVPFWPPNAPAPGHMGVLPSEVGPEPIVRLQAGGLKVGQVLLKPAHARSRADLDYVDEF